MLSVTFDDVPLPELVSAPVSVEVSTSVFGGVHPKVNASTAMPAMVVKKLLQFIVIEGLLEDLIKNVCVR